jgi:site-specific DNA-methyltransferase (adenine-specific)
LHQHAEEAQQVKPYFEDQAARVRLYHGDCLDVMRSLRELNADCVLADPPYSSGGLHRSDRIQGTGEKYVLHGTALERPDFAGDSRDQRSWVLWSSLWMGMALRCCHTGAVMLAFADWRQVPACSDAIQAGGWIWRGIVPWDKTEGARPQRGFFRAQCEYVLSASAGSMGKEQERAVGVCKPGIIYEGSEIIARWPRTQDDRQHQTGKPVQTCAWLLEVVRPGGWVLDPFAGSGSAGVAAVRAGLGYVGIESEREILEGAAERLRTEIGQRLPGA